MRIVIVGATGNLGTAVLRRFWAEKEPPQLVGVARRMPDVVAEPYGGVEWHRVDIADDASPARLRDIFTAADAVIHLAWLLQPNHHQRVLWRTNVLGHRHVLEAAAEAGVPQVLVASSVGAYSPGPKRGTVDESWPTGGIHTSHYARFKAMTERYMDRFEAAYPEIVLARIRPGLVMHVEAAAEVKRLFLGPLVPTGWIGRVPLPPLPLPSTMVSQVVHASDLADAFARATYRRAAGAFNIAADPVITPQIVAGALRSRPLPVRARPIRAVMAMAWRAHLIAADPGWLDLATELPVMSTRRARDVLGWSPAVDGADALREMVRAIASPSAVPASPPLSRDGTWRERVG